MIKECEEKEFAFGGLLAELLRNYDENCARRKRVEDAFKADRR
jgi:hypothetical protein